MLFFPTAICAQEGGQLPLLERVSHYTALCRKIPLQLMYNIRQMNLLGSKMDTDASPPHDHQEILSQITLPVAEVRSRKEVLWIRRTGLHQLE